MLQCSDLCLEAGDHGVHLSLRVMDLCRTVRARDCHAPGLADRSDLPETGTSLRVDLYRGDVPVRAASWASSPQRANKAFRSAESLEWSRACAARRDPSSFAIFIFATCSRSRSSSRSRLPERSRFTGDGGECCEGVEALRDLGAEFTESTEY